MSSDAVHTIEVPYPAASDLHLRLGVGACRLRLVPGHGPNWVSGTYRDPSRSLPPKVVQEGGSVRITQEPNWADMFNWLSGVPTFELALGRERPFALTLETGASESDADLGGLPITRLVAKYGAGKVTVGFSAPNPQPMTLVSISTGAGGVELRQLANANFVEMLVEAGAAACKLDFTGTLRRDAHVRINTALSSVSLVLPGSTAAKVTLASLTGGLAHGAGLTRREGGYWTEAAVAGASPVLTVNVTIALGSLNLDLA